MATIRIVTMRKGAKRLSEIRAVDRFVKQDQSVLVERNGKTVFAVFNLNPAGPDRFSASGLREVEDVACDDGYFAANQSRFVSWEKVFPE